MKNNGKPSEEIFDDAWKPLGKKAYVFKFEDTASLRGRNKKAVFAAAQPCDRLVVHDGRTFFAEIKSTIDPERFKFSLLRRVQSYAATAAAAAGGDYFIFIHNLTQDQWFRVPYSVVAAAKAEGRGSLTWAELTPYSWSFPCA